MDILRSSKAKRMRREGASFREIADALGLPLHRVKRQLRDAPGGRNRREMRDEVRDAGGMHPWWDNAPADQRETKPIVPTYNDVD